MDRELLIEIGCEEIPAGWLPGLTSQLATHLDKRLKDARLTSDRPTESYSTPRRLTARVMKLAERQTDHEEIITGPPVSAAFKPDGEATPAAAGFAKKYGVEVSALERSQTPKGAYLAYRMHQRGKATVDVLGDVLGGLLRDLTFPKQMRWDAFLEDGKGDLVFARPIRWLILLYGGRVVPFVIRRTELAQGPLVQDICTGPNTYGHRFLTTSGRAGRAIKVKTFEDYEARLLENFVILDRSERESKIRRELEMHARKLGGRVSGLRRGAVVTAAGSSRSRRISVGSRGTFPGGVPATAGGSADDDDDPSSALLPGRGRGRQAEAGVPRRDEHAGGKAGSHRAQFGTRADGAAA